MTYATKHFRQRVAERLSADVNADQLAQEIIEAIQQGRHDRVEFVARINRESLRVFRFRAPTGRTAYALVDTEAMRCVTLLPPGFAVSRQNRAPMKLRAADL